MIASFNGNPKSPTRRKKKSRRAGFQVPVVALEVARRRDNVDEVDAILARAPSRTASDADQARRRLSLHRVLTRPLYVARAGDDLFRSRDFAISAAIVRKK